MSSNEIVLISSDGQTFKVDEAVAREFQIVAHMIDDDCADKPIPLANVTGHDLALVIEYCKKHVELGVSVEGEVLDAKDHVEASVSVEEEDKKTALKDWDADFMKRHDLETIFQLVLAANYLNVKGLLDLVCQTIADDIKEKTPEEIRTMFNIKNDFTPEEEAEVRKENSWAFE